MRKKKNILSTLGVSLLFILARFLFRSSGSPTSDALFFTGAISISVGILTYLSSRGELSTLGYIISRGVGMLIPRADHKHETFYEYKTRKSEEHSPPPYRLVFIGTALAVSSLVALLF